MMECNIIHITGASGAGTTTLAKAVCEKYGYVHLDTDDFFWETTDPPFTVKRGRTARQYLLNESIEKAGNCVISGSLDGWGDIFIPKFDLVVYLHTETNIRLERLHCREFRRFGTRIQPGGDMYFIHKDFIKWAAAYDVAGVEIRSKRLHDEWLKEMSCPIIRLDGAISCEDNLQSLECYIHQH